jgi:hypothetical protein
MLHKAYLWQKPADQWKDPWHVECSCGPAGDFPSELQATAWIEAHFGKQTGVFTTELIKGDPKKIKPADKPASSFTPQVSPTRRSPVPPTGGASTFTPKVK